jgi:hypothetical protein
MKFVRDSTLREYARLFWKRQNQKPNADDRPALEDLQSGGDPLGWLVNLYPYKLPKPCNGVIQVVSLDAVSEIDRFLIHDYMIRDKWMVDRCLVPCPKTRRLGDMVTTAIERQYFQTSRDDTQVRIYTEWSQKTTIHGLIEQYGAPLIEMTWPDEYEIVDGWGRLHAISALVRSGLEFEPFECYVASSIRIEPSGAANGSQPIRAETKRPSSAAGSRR